MTTIRVPVARKIQAQAVEFGNTRLAWIEAERRKNKMRSLSFLAARAGATLAIACFSPAEAALDYSIEAGVGYSDNITRVVSDHIDETIAAAGLDLSWAEERRRLSADVDVNLDYLDYLDDTYDSEVVGTADAVLVIGIIPERFTWLVQDSFGQVRSDPFEPVTPETRENINYVTTGPNLTFRIGSAGIVRALARYSESQYEESPLDSDRLTFGVGVGRELSAGSELSLNGLTESIDFDDPANVDYDRESIFSSYLLQGSRTEVTIAAGYTWLDRDDGIESGGELLRVDVNRRVSSASTVALSFGSQFTDASEALRSSVDVPSSGGSSGVASSDPFENRFASLSWSFTRNRTSLALGVRYHRDRYEVTNALDRKLVSWDASFERRLSRTLTAGILASLIEEEFDSTGFQSDETRAGISCTWQMGRRFGLRLLAERLDREASDIGDDVVENRAFLTLFYDPAET
jgi:hypothetical protein